MYIIIGILIAALGALLVIKTEWFEVNFGTIRWGEENLGMYGGSRLTYKLIGVAIIFIGFLLITGLFNGFLEGTVGRIFIRE